METTDGGTYYHTYKHIHECLVQPPRANASSMADRTNATPANAYSPDVHDAVLGCTYVPPQSTLQTPVLPSACTMPVPPSDTGVATHYTACTCCTPERLIKHM